MSFSSEIKEHLLAEDIKNKCCALAEMYFYMLFYGEKKIKNADELFKNRFVFICKKTGLAQPDVKGTSKNGKISFEIDPTDTFSSIKDGKENILSKDCCQRAFLKTAFIMCGTVNDPKNRYARLEFSLPTEELKEIITDLFTDAYLSCKETFRFEKYVLYFTRRENVSDVLTLIGANKERLIYEQYSIEKEVNNNVNRVVNCDNYNMNYSVMASEKQLNAIRILREKGLFEELGDDLKLSAIIRENNPELSITELAEIHRPSISRSGLSHRLSKIVKAAEKYM